MSINKRPGRPRQDKVHINITLSRLVYEALQACEGNISGFLERLALKDERVAAYVAQGGVCKAPTCKERIDGDASIYCAVPNAEMSCPGWFCRRHYAEVHFSEEE